MTEMEMVHLSLLHFQTFPLLIQQVKQIMEVVL